VLLLGGRVLVDQRQDHVQKALALERAREQHLDLHVGRLGAQHRLDPLARDQVEDRQRARPGPEGTR
jgi:hypothetical protein